MLNVKENKSLNNYEKVKGKSTLHLTLNFAQDVLRSSRTHRALWLVISILSLTMNLIEEAIFENLSFVWNEQKHEGVKMTE